MLRRLSLLLTFAVVAVTTYAQQGTLQGKIYDKETKEPLAFANIVIELNDVQQGGASSDFDGEYKIAGITPGTYTVKATYSGYKTYILTGVEIKGNKVLPLDIPMEVGIELNEFVVQEYEVPLIDKDGGASGATVTREDISRMPGRSATAIASTVGGVYSSEGSGALSIRGSRSDASYYFIDGIKVRGGSGLPKSAIQEVQVLTGGLPANYGDATGGIISITTRGASKDFFGGIDYLTSGFKAGDNTFGLDRYAYNLIEGYLSGPLWIKKDSTGKKEKPILGFFLSGNYTNIVDGRPFFTDQYQVKDDVRANLLTNPLRPTGTGFGAYYNTDFLSLNDFEKVKFRQNAGEQAITGSGKIDVNLGPQINLTFGGSLDYGKYANYDYNNMLFNSENNAEIKNLTWRVYGRFTQRFGSAQGAKAEESASIIKNAYYTVMVDYSKFRQTVQDANHKDNLFNYGYVGQYKIYREKSYDYTFIDSLNTYARVHNGWKDTLVTFTPYYVDPATGEQIDVNPDLAAVTNQYFSLYDEVSGNYENLTQIQSGRGLRNGDSPSYVYSLWNNIGTQYNGYGLVDNTQFRVTASGNADIGKHAISLGFEYEQRNDRAFNASPIGLWTIGRQLLNYHTQELDLDNPAYTWFGSVLSVDYNVLNGSPGEYNAANSGETQFFFDYNVRKNLGLNPDGTDQVDIDEINPEFLQLGWFSANELLNSGQNYVSYYGYTYDGKKQTDKVTFEDFFSQRDEYGNQTRAIAPYEPIYIAGYIMDKFVIDNLIFNVGVRVDRFDANQNVLKDPYLLYEAKTVKEVDASVFDQTHPSNMGDDYVVYVDNVEAPNTILGYRNDRTWYNASGAQISDPTLIYGPNGVAPYLVNPNARTLKDSEMPKAFTDYKPQVNVMPRIAFSFPISEEALFFAHYDVLTKRPTTGNRLDLLDYYFLDARTDVVNNPDLKPEKTIDYELGFQQVLTKSSSLKISAFYRELRDQVALYSMTGAYPRTYRTYYNLDFGTVKGMTITYDMRRTKNLTIRMSYTLQFAEGTGSDAGSSLNLVNSGQPNLRTIYPLDYDQRHALVGVIDYRYGEGSDYNGPVLFGKKIFQNAGINVTSNLGSGTPYSARQLIVAQAFIEGNGSSSLEGQVNGSRLPSQFRMDAQIDKNWTLKFGKEDKPVEANLQVYLQITNVLNTRNILGVYGATGSPSDDGYLAEPRYTTAIASQNSEQSFRDYYALKVNSPYNYGLPRTIRLGIKFDF